MRNIAPIFKNKELQTRFDEDGYVKLQLVGPARAKELYDFYINNQSEHSKIEGRYHSTTHTNNADLILKVDKYLKSALLPELEAFFRNYEPMMCTYITKVPGEGSETRLHQDPTFVDEENYVSANIWVALHDIDHQNGNLFFVKGTHRIMPSLRVTPDCPTAYDNVKDLLRENITEVPVKAGEAIVINHATMHGATPNLSESLRIAAVLAIRSSNSEWIYHYLEPGSPYNKIEKYKVNLSTFVNLKKDGRPEKDGFAGYISYDFPQINREDFIKKFKIKKLHNPVAGWLRRLLPTE